MRRASFIWLLLWPIAAEAQAPSSTLFDLVCVGTSTLREATQQPFRQVIHVDLTRRLYCVDDCLQVATIKELSASLVTFRDKPSDGYYLVDRATWNRSDGTYQESFAATFRAYFTRETRARCRTAPLSILMNGRR
jgi:hypothetical protein